MDSLDAQERDNVSPLIADMPVWRETKGNYTIMGKLKEISTSISPAVKCFQAFPSSLVGQSFLGKPSSLADIPNNHER